MVTGISMFRQPCETQAGFQNRPTKMTTSCKQPSAINYMATRHMEEMAKFLLVGRTVKTKEKILTCLPFNSRLAGIYSADSNFSKVGRVPFYIYTPAQGGFDG